MRPIDADALKTCVYYDKQMCEIIDEAPTIDQAENGGCRGCCCERLGQWRRDNKIIVCSECGGSFRSDQIEELMDSFTYCPYCGARMDIE